MTNKIYLIDSRRFLVSFRFVLFCFSELRSIHPTQHSHIYMFLFLRPKITTIHQTRQFVFSGWLIICKCICFSMTDGWLNGWIERFWSNAINYVQFFVFWRTHENFHFFPDFCQFQYFGLLSLIWVLSNCGDIYIWAWAYSFDRRHLLFWIYASDYLRLLLGLPATATTTTDASIVSTTVTISSRSLSSWITLPS